jgi:uncharacterized membrane protein
MLSPESYKAMPTSTETASQSSPHDKVSRGQFLVWGVGVAIVLVMMSMIVGAPIALSHGYPVVAVAIYKGFSPLCHQISERSFHVEGHAFAVCARCTGIYAGFAAGVIFYPLMRSLKRTDTPDRKWLLLAAVPIFVDWSLTFTGIWDNTHLSRFLTGALLGTVCALYVVPGLMDLLQLDWRRFFTNASREEVRKPATTLPMSHDRTAPSDFGSPTSRI